VKTIEHVIFEWMNFILLVGGLFYMLKNPGRELLSGRREKIQVLIWKARHYYDEAHKKNQSAKAKLELVDADIASLKRSLEEMGSYGRMAILERARETGNRIHKETEFLTAQEQMRMRLSLSKQALSDAFEKARTSLITGISRDDQLKFLDESLKTLRKLGATKSPESKHRS
jgi:F0F1-type ATP synthase membrane subunit b/b'